MSEKESNWKFAEDIVAEPETIARAREHSLELGVEAVSPAIGAQISVIAAASRATSMIEIGTGLGVSGLYLLAGAPDATLTTIDVEVEHQRAAREAFADEGVRPTRTRLIAGRALDVLPRLTDGGYDLVLVDADPESYPAYLAQAIRLLRPGGVLVIDDALWQDRVADPAKRDEVTTTVREVGRAVRDDDRLTPALLPTGDGLLVAVRR